MNDIFDMERLGFYIGINCYVPGAFGVYSENGRFVVYRNDVSGNHMIRYQGTDEAYAVNLLYERLVQKVKCNKNNLSYTDQSDWGSFNIERVLIALCATVGLSVLFCVLAVINKALLVVGLVLGVGSVLAILCTLVTICILMNIKSKIATKLVDAIHKRVIVHYLIMWVLCSILALGIAVTYLIPVYALDSDDNIYCRYKAKTYIYNGYDYLLFKDGYEDVDSYVECTFYIEDFDANAEPFFESDCYELYYSEPSTPSYYLE